jgi:hypothetical protein
MKQFSATALLCFSCLYVFAQKPKNQIFAISAEKAGSFDYSSIQLINTENGKPVKQFFGKNSSFEAGTIKAGRKFNASTEFRGVDSFMHPMGNLTGAAAIDVKNNRLFFAPIGTNQLRYLDLNNETPSFTYIDDQPFGEARVHPGAQISRLVIDAKGNGYGLSNDGEHLIKFTTDKKVSITDLGPVKDNPADTVNGYHKNCSCLSYGGDMVADAEGDLYVITANNRVHKIEMKSQQITFLSTVKGLPEGFTTNGAAVDEDGNVIISSAVSTAEKRFSFYKVNMKTFEAAPLTGEFLNASDLASNNFIPVANEKLSVSAAQFSFSETLLDNKNITVFPNPVKGTIVRIVLNDLAPGNYTAALFDAQGRITGEKKFRVTSKTQTEQMNAPAAQGQYILNIINKEGRSVYNGKVLITTD